MFNEVKDEDHINLVAQTIGGEDLAEITITNYYMKRIATAHRSRQPEKIAGILEDYTKSINSNYEVYSDHEGGFYVEAAIYTDGVRTTANISYSVEHISILNGGYDSEDGIRQTIRKGDVLEVEELQGVEYEDGLNIELTSGILKDGTVHYRTDSEQGTFNIDDNKTHWTRITNE